MPRDPDFFRRLNEQLLEQLEEHARQPGRTGDEVFDWLTEREVKTSRSAVYRWLQDFRLEDRTRRAAVLSDTLVTAAKESGGLAIQDAALLQLSHLIFDAAVNTDGVSADDLNSLSL